MLAVRRKKVFQVCFLIVYWFNYGEREYFRCNAKSISVYEKSTLDFENIRWDSNCKKIPADQREAGIFLFLVLTQEERNKKKVKAWKSSSFSFETLRIITQTCYAMNSFSCFKTDGCASNMGSNTLRLFD